MSSQKEPRRYDNVRIVNQADGAVVGGHEDVRRHLESEKKMLEEYGASIIFQVYRLNLQAGNLKDLQGSKLTEIKVDGSFVSGSDTVASVKDKVRSLLREKAGTRYGGQILPDPPVASTDHLTLYLAGRPLQDDTIFYADNSILLPVWIQVLLHRCDSAKAVQIINKLQKKTIASGA